MDYNQLDDVVNELRQILIEKEITPKEAEIIKVKSVGLTNEEKEIFLRTVRMGIKRIQYKRIKEKRPRLLYWIHLK